MATESYLVTALPYSASSGEKFHVSLFVTHRITPDGAEGVVNEFALARDWTARLARARCILRGGDVAGGVFDIPCTPLLDALDPALWPRVFPGSLPVRPWRVPDRTTAPWKTFPAHRMQQHALLVHAASLYSSPVAPPTVAGNALADPLLESLGLSVRQLPLSRIIDGAHDRQISNRLDDLSGGGGLSGPVFEGSQPLLQMVADAHRARKFYQRDDAASNPYRERPDPAAVAKPVEKPKPDFHERAGMLGDLSPLLRTLGLVIDLRVDDLRRLAGAVWIQGDVVIDGHTNAQRSQPRTACRVVGETFTATPSSGDWELGMLKVGDEDRFTVLDLDPDASALKLEQYTRTLPRLAASEGNGDPTSSAPSTLRATGFGLARINRAQQLHDRLAGAAAQDAALLSGTAPPLTLEQVNRGVRLEVWDDVSTKWHSLHRRHLTVEVEGGGRVVDRVPDAGFLQGAALASREDDPAKTKYAHEVVAGWDGWSLSTPRPGKVVVHDDGDEVVMDAPPADPSPVNPVASTTEIAPGTLPRLRYGRSYAFRAYAVDLAGNSRPHDVAGVSPNGNGGGNVNGIVLAAPDAAQHVQSRLANRVTDATRLTAHPQGGAATDFIRSRIVSMRTPRVEGPVPNGGVRGVDPGGITPTRIAEIDRLITSRVTARLQDAAARGVTRAQQIDLAFTDATSRVQHLMERTDLQLAPQVAGTALSTMLAGQRGLGPAVGRGRDLAQIITIASDLITTPRPFLRWDPVIEPAAVARYAFTEGESLLRLVIRSGVEQAPGDLALTVTPPAAYVAEVLAERPALNLTWREDSQRHLAPPKTSQLEAELHGAFEAAMGNTAPADRVRAALGIALREAGTFLDVTVADLANPGQRLPQPGVTFHVTPTAEVPPVQNPGDLPKGNPLNPGQYVAHDADQVVLPYLPDPLAAGVSFTFPDAGKDHRLTGLFAVEGTTLRYLGDWPEKVPFRFVLESGPELGAIVDGHVVRVSVPPGEQLRMRMSSSLTKESLNLFGLWRSLPPAIRDNPILREAAADGWFWWLTPSTEVRLVHAVPRPLEAPRPTILMPVRAAGDTAVTLFGAVDVHGPSTERIDVEASWSQWVDDIAKPAPERVTSTAIACGTPVGYHEDLVVLTSADGSAPLPDGTTLRLHGAVHQTGDTLHRMIDYRVRATTRYREYFPPQLTADVDDISVVGPTRTLDVPSSARPRKVIMRDVLPLFRWDERTEPAQPFGLRRSRRAGVRIYMERPWYSTGDGELLGVIVAAGSDATVHGAVSQWGADPVFFQQGPAVRGTLPLVDLLHMSGLDDRRVRGRPVAPPATRTLVDRDGQPTVWVLGYQPEYSPERGLWFVDIALDPGTAFWPFVQLAVARYQPSSLAGLHLGPVTMCDFVQVVPERTATLSRTDETHARVVVTGAVGHPRVPRVIDGVLSTSFVAAVAATRKMRARLERFDAAVGTDLAWVTVSQVDLPILGSQGTVVSWAGEIGLPEAIAPRTPGENEEWRVTLEEWELLPADFEAGGTGGWEPRVVYADHLPL